MMGKQQTRPIVFRGSLIAALVVGMWVGATYGPADAAPPKDTTEKVVAPAAGSPDQRVQQALLAAADTDEARGFATYLELLHPRVKETPDAVEQLRRYSWKRFRKQAPDYLLAGTQGGFVLTRRDPPTLSPTTTHVRLFVKAVNNARRTFPTPIRLERAGDRWLITANSL